MSNVIIPSSLEDRKKIRGALEEISNSLTRIEAERSLIKEILQDVKINLNCLKSILERLLKSFISRILLK